MEDKNYKCLGSEFEISEEVEIDKVAVSHFIATKCDGVLYDSPKYLDSRLVISIT